MVGGLSRSPRPRAGARRAVSGLVPPPAPSWDRWPWASPSRCGREVGSSPAGSGAGFMAYLPSRLCRQAESPAVSPGVRAPAVSPQPCPPAAHLQGAAEFGPIAWRRLEPSGTCFGLREPCCSPGLGRAVVCSLLLKARPSLNMTPADPGLSAQRVEIRSCSAIPGLETPT